ncbi:MAG: DUF2141 domain-containing protein [Flavobacteriales bacterium]|jgi:uncharacterized protein (DUF2141 family)|nr:DUF2141 domain-containing protein [Flavobacteriales bacterium]MBK6752835.1 DUF2141 domain-containing protein [Flavobacteriales bacterium]MBK7085237.1 DUF2141 domain-containing protein [Flavobacteriales bacterium]MBK7270675.1 DUF2141 domain-containing protein [Flavobacteriales bacterium]MBK7754011.1 DUF2141 domain-containing protein [Flavobacteriales bacterium]
MRSILVLALSLYTAPLRAQADVLTEITLPAKITTGTLMLALCTDTNTFAEEFGGALRKVEASGPMVQVRFENLAPGKYALKAFLDQNGNGKLDLSPKGFPQEPFGFSNNAFGRPGPALFNKAAFPVGGEDVVVKIRLKG